MRRRAARPSRRASAAAAASGTCAGCAACGRPSPPRPRRRAARGGGADGQRSVRGLLGLGSAELAAPEPPAGWRLETWLGRVPDEYVESYARAREALDDAPTEAGVRYAAPSVERVRAMEESL